MSEPANQNRGAEGRLDFLIGLLAVIAAAVVLFWVIPAEVEMPSHTDQLSPRFFPSFTAIMIGLFGLALMIKNRRSALRRVPHDGPRLLLETLAWAVWALISLLLLIHAGFIIAGALSSFAGMLLAGQRRRLVWCALGSILLPVAIQQLAWHIFYIQLP